MLSMATFLREREHRIKCKVEARFDEMIEASLYPFDLPPTSIASFLKDRNRVACQGSVAKHGRG